jgi:O-antigen/teichoic acid export membrane protein
MCLPLGMVARHLGRIVRLGWSCRMPLWPPRPGPLSADSRGLLREVLHYSWPIHLGALAEFITMYLDNVVVGQLYSAAAQGLYAVGYTLVMTPSETIAMYGATAMVRALGLNDVEARQRTFLQGLRYVSLLLWPIGAGAGLVAGTLEVALLPPSWHGIAGVVGGLGLGGAALGITRMCFAQLTALHRTRAGGFMYALQLAAFLLGLFLVGRLDHQRQHMPAVALAVSVAFSLTALLGLALSISTDKLPLRGVLGALAPAFFGSLVMAAGVWGLQQGLVGLGMAPSRLRLLLEIGSGILLYAAYLRLLHRDLWQEATTWLAQRRRA